MSYQVLARKWRPRNFGEMVGQSHVLRALINALDTQRLHHAYLFAGTRGVGKTTVARIFAKSLNCEVGVSASPCGECSACREIDEGRFVDLVEVDAASRTKVEDTRELLENVQYAPTRGRYKVYLIDEVHMLSGHSFNALLKTLEEPPPHVKFLLATTDPQRLPVTILSRCLQFNLKHLPPEQIRDHLAHVLRAEDIAADTAALSQLARAAQGSMRDALSLLDQAIAYGGGKVIDSDVRAMLGTIEHAHVTALVEALANGDGGVLLEQVAALSEFAPDYDAVLAELISLLHHIAVAQLVPEAVSDGDMDAGTLRRFADMISPEDVQLYYQIALLGRRDLALAPDARGGLEMALLRMLAFRPAAAATQSKTTAHGAKSGAAVRPKTTAATPPVSISASTSGPATSPAAASANADDWNALIDRLTLQGMVRQLAANCVLQRREDDTYYLAIAPAHASLRNARLEERLQSAVSEALGVKVKLVFSVESHGGDTPAAQQERHTQDKQRAAVSAIEEDDNVRTFKDTFGARVVPDSIEPLDND